MGQIHKKLKSNSGASIVLTLLFLLICMMVGASVLMAAASNAGKSRSNREENQIYLAMSSALRLVVDDLKGAKYCGQYTYTQEKDESGNITKEIYKQEKGKYGDGSGETELGQIVINDLDDLFAVDMKKWCDEKNEQSSSQLYEYIPLVDSLVKGPYTLTVTPKLDELKKYPIKITLSVKESYSMELTATIDNYPSFIMRAELTADANRPAVPENSTDGLNKTEPMEWKLGWITTGTEESDEAP